MEEEMTDKHFQKIFWLKKRSRVMIVLRTPISFLVTCHFVSVTFRRFPDPFGSLLFTASHDRD